MAPLPPKESALFKRIVKAYETKQYKSGIKAAKAILSTHPDHGETLCMKGLLLNGMSPDKKDEALALAKQGLKMDMKSHVCWHVYGLLHRSHREYGQAIRSYRQALRIDSDNLQILKDLSVLQIHMRDLQGFKASRARVWKLRPQQPASWLGYAVAHHMCGEYRQAVEVLSGYETTQQDLLKSAGTYNYERSELIMYKAQILEEAGDAEAALTYLIEQETKVCDRRAFKESYGRLNLSLGKLQEAEKAYRMLIDENPENEFYMEQLERCVGLGSDAPEADRLKFYEELRTKYNRSTTLRRLPLRFATGKNFQQLLDSYLKPGMRKGCTPLFRVLRPLYSDKAKREAIEKTLLGYHECLLANGKLDKSDSAEESPSMHVWLNFFLAQHYDIAGDQAKALEHVNKAIEHTPTVIELYMIKAKILKHGGDVEEAAHWLNYAREMDTADRFINSKCVKYQLRAGKVTEAEENVALFTREAGNDPIVQLADMQCVWFDTEEGRAHVNKGDLATALKKFHSVQKHFDQYLEDQFDFHNYCQRKMTLRAYIRLLRMEDRLWGHKFFTKAALAAIDCYVSLHDTPYSEQSAAAQDPSFANMTEAEKKKALSKIRRQKKKADAARQKELELAAQKKAAATGGVAASAAAEVNLAETKTPLDDVKKFLLPLQNLAADQISTHVAAFEVYSRRKKPLLMLKAVKLGLALDASDPQLHKCVVQFLSVLATTELSPIVKKVVDLEMDGLVSEKDPKKYNKAFLAKHKTSPAHLLAHAEAEFELVGKADLSAVTKVDETSTLSVCLDVLAAMTKTFKSSEDEVKSYKVACHKRFPLATAFTQ